MLAHIELPHGYGRGGDIFQVPHPDPASLPGTARRQVPCLQARRCRHVLPIAATNHHAKSLTFGPRRPTWDGGHLSPSSPGSFPHIDQVNTCRNRGFVQPYGERKLRIRLGCMAGVNGGAAMKAVAIISGGLDSTVLAYLLKRQGYVLETLSFDYGQRHRKELEYARRAAADLDASWRLIDLNASG